jgi:hypothetical protein
MASMVVQSPRLAMTSEERLRAVREYLDELLPFWNDPIASIVDRSPSALCFLLGSSDTVLLRLSYHAYIHTLADQGLAPRPQRLGAVTLVKNSQLRFTSRFPGFDTWAVEKSLSDGVSAVASVHTHPSQASAP